MISVVCGIAGAIAAYGAVQAQADVPAGNYLIIGGVLIIIFTLANDYFENYGGPDAD